MKYVFVLLLLSMSIYSGAQIVDSNYEVATWQGFAGAAITYTFDDNTANQHTVALPIFDEFGFNATFYPVINWSPNWSTFQKAANAGHEIGSHSVSHSNLGNLSTQQQDDELKNSKAQIETRIQGQQCLTIAYPFCAPSERSITESHYIAARHCQGQIEKSTPTDFYNINSIICGSQGAVKTAKDFSDKAKAAANSKGWCVYLLHGVDNDGGYSPVPSSVLRESLEYFDQDREKYWVSTFSNVVKYIKQRNNVSVKEIDSSETGYKIEVTDDLDNSIFNFPISLKRQIPSEWDEIEVLQKGEAVHFEVKAIDALKYVVFDVVPDGGEVEINKGGSSSSSLQPKKSSFRLTPNPFSGLMKIELEGDFEYQVYSLNGKLVDTGMMTNKGLIGENFSKGVYMLSIKNYEGIFNQKIMKL